MNNELIKLREKIRDTLEIFYPLKINISDLVTLEGKNIGIKISIIIPNDEIQNCLSKWQSWKNAFKYRKR